MRQQTFTLIIAILFFTTSSLFAQWESLGEDIITPGHRVWSMKVAPDASVWVISTYDNFPPTDQTPTIHRSTDEGQTWTSTSVMAGESVYGWDISPIDSNTAYITLHTEGLHKTTDGGQTWQKVESFTTSLAMIVHFFNEEEGFVLGANDGYLITCTTNDGGENWTYAGGPDWVQPLGTSLPAIDSTESLPGLAYSLVSSYDYTDKDIVIGTAKGTYWKSTDKGYNWTRHPTPLVDLGINLSCIAMKDENTIMVAGDFENVDYTDVEGVSFTTLDGNETWIEGKPWVTQASIHYIPDSDSVFIMTGHFNTSWGLVGTSITYDYGANWDILDYTPNISIDFLDQNTGYGTLGNLPALNSYGEVYKWNYDITTSTRETTNNIAITLMPNPVSSDLFIATNQAFNTTELTLEIINNSGQILSQQQAPNDGLLSIDISHLPRGMYLLKITGDDKSVVEKFVKE